MILLTYTDKSWITDGPNSDKKNDFDFQTIIINSIKWDINKYIELNHSKENKCNEAIYYLGNTNEIDINLKSPEFKIPEFKKTYQLTDYRNYFSKSQNWIGHIIDISETGFKATLSDLTNPGTTEVVDFENTEISEEDIPLIKLGAAFYWSIGIANSNGQRKSESLIRFQRFSPWTTRDYDTATDRAQDLSKNLIWE